MGIVHSLHDLREKISATVKLPSFEERRKLHRTHIAETIPKFLQRHEAILERSGGVYYNGDKVKYIH
jgi:Glutathione S-transferase, C-terminal domain